MLIGAVAGLVIVSLTIYLCYRFAARAARMLGDAFVVAAQQRMPDGGADTGGGGTATAP